MDPRPRCIRMHAADNVAIEQVRIGALGMSGEWTQVGKK